MDWWKIVLVIIVVALLVAAFLVQRADGDTTDKS